MRKLRVAVVAVATLACSLIGASPAGADVASAGAFSFTPTKGPAGTSITVSSTQPCPAPPAGATAGPVGVAILDSPGQLIVGGADATLKADRSWTATVPIISSVRNGAYFITAGCTTAANEVYAVYGVEEFDVTSPAGKSDPAVRFAGTDRITTAITASTDTYPSKPSTDVVVLSRSDSFADALAGTPLAASVGGPLLLTGRDQLDPRTEAEIARVMTPNGTVYLLGGPAAISEAVATSLKSSGYTVTRLAGANRYETAVKIADEIGTPTTLLLATGGDFKAGLVAGAAAWAADEGDGGGAVLLTDGKAMPPATKAYLAAHGAAKRYAIGAPAAAADPGATAITGADDADVSAKVAAQFFPDSAAVAIATSGNFADALSGGAHAVAFGAPLLLTAPNALPAPVSAFLRAGKARIVIAFVYGGPAAVSEAVRSAVVTAIT